MQNSSDDENETLVEKIKNTEISFKKQKLEFNAYNEDQ